MVKVQTPIVKVDDEKQYSLEPLVEVLSYSKIKYGDVLILRCKNGKENAEISKLHPKLKMLLSEKNLKILALNKEDRIEDLSLVVQLVKSA